MREQLRRLDFSADSQARMAATLDGGPCEIQRKTSVSTPIGGNVPGWVTVATVPRHSVGPVGGSPAERAIAEKVSAYQMATISFPAGTEVRMADQILINGVAWGVAGVIAGHTNTLLVRVVATRSAS